MKEESDLRQKVHDEIQYVEWNTKGNRREGQDSTAQEVYGIIST